jgi:alkanesulfonate monooxygenase SsuD/methylene tetrahydromethanopterin reductase-like flavin-dependent oxidoreductase (luciferase family)
MQLNNEQRITWNGKFRPSLHNAKVFPQPLSGKLPIWRPIGEHHASAIQAGRIGVLMHISALYVASSVFEKRVDAYRRAAKYGYDTTKLPVAVATMMYLNKDSQTAVKDFPISE